MSELSVSRYEPLLKEDLKCWRCYVSQKNIPTLKAHLQEEWDKEKRKATTQKKRKRDEATDNTAGEPNADDDRQTKRLETLESAAAPTPPVV